MVEKPQHIGESMMFSPVYWAETYKQANFAVNKISHNTSVFSLVLTTLKEDSSEKIALVTIFYWGGPVYIFDVLKGGKALVNSQRTLKSLLESPNIMKITYDCKSVAGALKREFNIDLNYSADVRFALEVLEGPSENLDLFEFCLRVTQFEIPFYEDVTEESSSNQNYWKERPLLYHMHSFLSGMASLIFKAYFDIRVYLTNEQVEAILRKSMMAVKGQEEEPPPIPSEALIEVPGHSFVFESSLPNFKFDNVSLQYVLEKAVKEALS